MIMRIPTPSSTVPLPCIEDDTYQLVNEATMISAKIVRNLFRCDKNFLWQRKFDMKFPEPFARSLSSKVRAPA